VKKRLLLNQTHLQNVGLLPIYHLEPRQRLLILILGGFIKVQPENRTIIFQKYIGIRRYSEFATIESNGDKLIHFNGGCAIKSPTLFAELITSDIEIGDLAIIRN